VYCKHDTGRFPEIDEAIALVRSQLGTKP